VQIWKFCARPNGSVSPACPKPLGRYLPFQDSQQQYKNNNMNEQIERIKSKIVQLKELDKDFKLFGSQKHK